jgi:nicotinamide phosphoribosyltransferase
MKKFLKNFILGVDAYQMGHFLMIPPGMENGQVSQATFRKPVLKNDNRLISAGLTPFVKLELENIRITVEDVLEAKEFMNDFHADLKEPFARPYPFPEQMFMRIATEFDGKLPIVVTGLPDGQCHYVGEPHVQVWTDTPGMGELVGWIESTLLPYTWSMSSVATRGRKRKEQFLDFYKLVHRSMDEELLKLLIEYKFHDFGRRGAANSEMTGIAHLMNFLGTDTVDAAHIACKYLNNGVKFGSQSIMAAAHRTISAWQTEDMAYSHQIDQFKHTLQSVVADTYDYEIGADKIAKYGSDKITDDGLLTIRPDSGDPVECVIKGLRIIDKYYKYDLVDGLKLFKRAAIIQGDGIDDNIIFGDSGILNTVVKHGYSPLNVAFGMGQNNHAAQRSDTEEAYKTCMVRNPDGSWRGVMKKSNSPFKRSFPCPVDIDLNNKYTDRVIQLNIDKLLRNELNGFKLFYDGRPTRNSKDKCEIFNDNFSDIRKRTYNTWLDLESVVMYDTISHGIRSLQNNF